MLIQSYPYITVLKLVTGEEVMTTLTSSDIMSVTASKPLCIVATPQGTQFAPFMVMANPDSVVKIYKSNILAESTPQHNLQKSYEDVTSAILRVAPGTTL